MLTLFRRAALCAGLVACAALAAPAWAGERVSGSGRIATATRALAGYEGIALSAPFKLTLRAAGREGVQLRGDDNLLPLVETRVVESGGVRHLELRWKPGVQVASRDEIEVTVDLVKLRQLSVAGSGEVEGQVPASPALAIKVAGSGDVELSGVQSEELSIAVSGSGDVKMAGRATRLAVAISGSGEVDTDKLDADEVSVKLAGSGDAAVVAHKRLAVAIAGSGDVTYRGEAQPQLSVAGSGSVKRR